MYIPRPFGNYCAGTTVLVNAKMGRQMKTRSALRIALLLALSGIVSGCWSSWPWPGRTENTDGIGNSVIGNYMRDAWHNSGWDSLSGDDALKQGIIELIKKSPGKGTTRQSAESLGAHCAPAPSTECKYVGEAWYVSHGLPTTSAYYEKKAIVTIEVSFSYLKPQDLVVRRQERLVPDDQGD